MWLVLMMMSFILGALTSACVPINTKNTRQFIAGLMVLVLGSIAALDMYDEMRHSYGGFEAGNDFLFDGLSGLVYIYIIPVLFSVAQVLFIINSRKKIAVK